MNCFRLLRNIFLAGMSVVYLGGVSQAAVPLAALKVVNPGFEQGVSGWDWHVSMADADGCVIQADAHSGLRAFRMTNRSAFGPNVGAGLQQVISGLRPDTDYELSLWVKSKSAQDCWFGGGPGWAIRQRIPSDTPDWQRVALPFKTAKDATTWLVIINTDGPTKELLVDDVAVAEAGQRHTWIYPARLRPAAALAPGRFVVTPGAFEPDSYDASEDVNGTLTFTVPAGYRGGNVVIISRCRARPESVLGRIPIESVRECTVASLSFSISAALFPKGTDTITGCLDGVKAPIARTNIRRRDAAEILSDRILKTTERLAKMRAEVASRGLENNSYIRLGFNVVQRYLERVQSHNRKSIQSDYWSCLQLQDTTSVLNETGRIMRAPIPSIPPLTAGPVRIERGVFVTASGQPTFFGGYNGWKQVIADIPNFTGIGASIIENEMGADALGPDGSDSGAIESLISRFKRANESNEKYDLMLSPHNFPAWAMNKSSDVAAKGNEGFIRFNIDHPVARQAIAQWVSRAVSAVKNEPSLLSVNLSNEPVYQVSGRDAYSRLLWIEYLKKRHGNIETLNALYSTSYASFDDVPVPVSTPPDLAAPVEKLRAYYDWAEFNEKHFADWHRWMNGLVKAAAPNVLTHDKIMVFYALQREYFYQGVDPEQFCDITDIAGNDDYTSMPGSSAAPIPTSSEYAYGWREAELTYDLLRSFRHQPVFNSENHIIPDQSTEAVPADYVRSAMWQGAIHGVGASAIWVWAEETDPKSSLYGSIYFRPADVYGAGRAWLDARRCASQAAAIIRAQPHIAILYTRTSLFWQKNYASSLRAAYTALTFLGEPVTFVTEKELAEGTAPAVKAILLPQAANVDDRTIDALARFVKGGGTLIALGDGNLRRDIYNRERSLPASLKPAPLPFSDDDHVVFEQLAQIARNVGAPGELHDAQSGQPIFGIEYRVVSDQGKTYVSAINLMKSTVTVKSPVGRFGRVKDLLSGETVDLNAITLAPMQPRLIELR
ncbi:MAG: beta-galactosidase [Capsulimonadaceae bacterium]|nr:beta-galactosidase [Capsulimonadaceae bacterium]